MKFKEIVTIAKNSKNQQINLSLKKNKMKELDLDLEDLLEIKLKKKREQW